MRLLLTLVLLVAVFLGGYCFGNQPGRPDILGWARDAYEELRQARDEFTLEASAQEETVCDRGPTR